MLNQPIQSGNRSSESNAGSVGCKFGLIDWSPEPSDGQLRLLDREDLVLDTLTQNDFSQDLPVKTSPSGAMEKNICSVPAMPAKMD